VNISPDVCLNMQRALDLLEDQRKLADVPHHIEPIAASTRCDRFRTVWAATR